MVLDKPKKHINLSLDKAAQDNLKAIQKAFPHLTRLGAIRHALHVLATEFRKGGKP